MTLFYFFFQATKSQPFVEVASLEMTYDFHSTIA